VRFACQNSRAYIARPAEATEKDPPVRTTLLLEFDFLRDTG